MPGIVSYGAYIPLFRLGKATAGWDSPGERAIANFDEDSVTMGVAALRDALTAMDAATLDALYFASTTSPYAEKQSATTIAWAANLRTDIFTVDCTDSLRAGTNALKLALDATSAASAKRVAVVAADNRLAQPRSAFERTFGDGAATLVVGNDQLIASVDGHLSVSHEIMDVWRSAATDAFMSACFAVAAGVYDIVMAAGVEKLKDNPYTGLAVGAGNLTSGVEPAVPPPVQFALAATRHAHHYDLPMEELKRILAKIAMKNHANGAKNPKAHFRREIALEDVLKAPTVAWPLGLYDCCGVSDGAAVAIITRPDIAKKIRDDYVLVKGLGFAVSGRQGLLQDDYDFVHFEESVRAAKMAYEQAGIKNPLQEIDLAEVHDCFTITELLIYEDSWLRPTRPCPRACRCRDVRIER